MTETIVATTQWSEILHTSFGYYGRCTHGCPWVGDFTPSKTKAEMDAIMHDDDPTRSMWHTQHSGRPS